VGLGAEPRTVQDPAERLSYLERLRRAAGAATRELTSGRARRIAVALPAGEPDEAEAVTLGALLGGYAFRKYRTTGAVTGDYPKSSCTPAMTPAADRARILAEAMTLVRDPGQHRAGGHGAGGPGRGQPSRRLARAAWA